MKIEDVKKEMVAAATKRENTQIELFETKIDLLEKEIAIKSRTGVHPIEGTYVYDNDPEYQNLLVELTIANLRDAQNAMRAEIDKIKEHQMLREAE